MSTHLIEHYNYLQSVLSCYDRVVMTGTLPEVCYAQGMTSYLYAHQIKEFDYAIEFADPLRNKIRDNAQMIAKAHGVAIEHVNNSHLRKEDLVSKVLGQRGDHPGLCIFSWSWKRVPPTNPGTTNKQNIKECA